MTAAILITLLAVAFVISSRDISRRRHKRTLDCESVKTLTAARERMRRELRPEYPPPPAMPSEPVERLPETLRGKP